MKLFELLKKTISKMPNGWGERLKVDLTKDWTAPCDGLLWVKVSAQSDIAYIGQDSEDRYMGTYAYGGASSTNIGAVHKGKRYRISYRGQRVSNIEAYFTPFSYRGGYLSRIIKRLQSLTFKGVMA